MKTQNPHHVFVVRKLPEPIALFIEYARAILAASAGLRARTHAVPTKPPFAVKYGPVSGSAHLAVKAAASRAAYDWELSVDGGKSWTSLPTTLQARTVVTGLPVATSVMFRFRAVIKGGAADWSQPISLLVK